jgi:PAS domain S-box-containing protein
MMQRSQQQFETNYALGEGSEWFDVRIYPQDRGLSVFIQVSTGRKLMEEQLRQRTEEVDRFFTTSIDLLAIADTDGCFRRLNPEWEKALGYSLDEMLDHRFLDFVHPDDIQSTVEAVGELTAGKNVHSFTNRYRAKDGGYRYIEWRSVPYGNIIYAAARDITFRKQAEEALRESESKYRALVENAQEGIWAADENWMTVFVNQRMATMLGYRPDEIIGRPVVDFLDEKARKRFEEHKPLRQEGAKERYDFEIVRKDGMRIFVTVHISPLMVGDEFHGLLAMVSDITERKMMENALKEANAKLNLLNSLTRHDLNNQLVVMRGHLVLAEKGTHSDNLRSHLHKALKASDNISRLLEFSRDYQGLGKDAPLWLNLQEVCTLGLTSVDLGHIAVELDLGDFEVFADKMLEKVFHNLASNSIMHGERTSRISVSCQEQGSTLVITYVDDGVGIPYERKAEILGPNQGYHGLNLAKGVLEMTGMTIGECGVPGEGARFVITIPSQSYRRPKAKVR